MLGLSFSAAQAAVKGSASAVVSQTLGAVYDFVARDFFANYQRWAPQVVELEPKGPTPVRPGVTARQVTLDRGIRSESTFEVAAVEPPRRLVLEGLSESFRSTYEFHDAPSEGTEITFEFEMRELDLSMRPFAKLIRMALQEGAEQTIENLKSLLEDGPPYAEQARAS
ncbi:MAG: polyketide cyclase [Methylocystis sp.]|nr:MAG: polyketide cyclase [Methylocystis sp.]